MKCSLDPGANLAKAEEHVREAAGRGAQMVCLPELFRSQYFCREEDARWFDLAEPIPCPATERLGCIARDQNVVIVASLFERRTPGVYHNTAAVIGIGGEILGLYRKMHIPTIPCTSKNSTSLRAIWAFGTSTPRTGALRRWCAGTSGIRKRRAWRRSAALRFCSIRPQ